MNIELTMQQIYWEMKDVVEKYKKGEKLDFSEVNGVIEHLIRGAETCKKMIANREKIEDMEFYNMLKEFAFISEWNKEDSKRVLRYVPLAEKKDDGSEYSYHEFHFIDEMGRYYKYTPKYIKKYVTKEMLQDLFADNLQNVNMQVDEAIDASYMGSKEWSSVAQEYAKEFEERGFARRLKQLNDTKFTK